MITTTTIITEIRAMIVISHHVKRDFYTGTGKGRLNVGGKAV